MKLKLSSKIILIAAFPSLFYIILGWMRISESLDEYGHTKEVTELISVLNIASGLISNTMEERGRSDHFLRTGEDKSEVLSSRQKGDVILGQLRKSLETDTLLSKQFRDEFFVKTGRLNQLRLDVDSKDASDASAIYTAYSQVVEDMLGIYATATSVVRLPGIPHQIEAIAMHESSKAHTGILRSAMTRIVSDDTPLAGQSVLDVVSRRTQRDTTLASQGMASAAVEQEKLAQMTSAGHWRTEADIFQTVIAKRDEGDFGFDPKEVFSVYSQIVNDISNLAKSEFDMLQTGLQAKSSDALSNAVLVSSLVILAAATIFVLLLVVVRQLNKSVSMVVRDLIGCSVGVAAASDRVKISADNLSDGASESASSIEQVVSSVQEISSMVKQNAENSKQASALSEVSRDSARRGQSEINGLIESIKEISSSSAQMESIIKVIDDIAFQTNLLALNAAVEAARAGEQGRGFAVVADAVRSLAQRCAESAKTISELIKNTVDKSESGSEIAEKSRDVLQEIVDGAIKAADLVAEISTASEEQSRGIATVGQALGELDVQSQRTAKSALEASDSSIKLSGQSESLLRSVDMLNMVVNASTIESLSDASHLTKPASKTPDVSGEARPVVVDDRPSVPGGRQKTAAEELIPFDTDDDHKQRLNDLSGF